MERTATRVWKRLGRDDRLAAARAFVGEASPELLATAIGAVAQARRLRPQVARALSDDETAAALATILEPGEALAANLLVSLHLAARRPLLAAFLDALGLPHEDGILKDEADGLPAPTADDVARARAALAGFDEEQVRVYFNVLYLQDPERWAGLAEPG